MNNGEQLYRVWCTKLASQVQRGEAIGGPAPAQWEFLTVAQRMAWEDTAAQVEGYWRERLDVPAPEGSFR